MYFQDKLNKIKFGQVHFRWKCVQYRLKATRSNISWIHIRWLRKKKRNTGRINQSIVLFSLCSLQDSLNHCLTKFQYGEYKNKLIMTNKTWKYFVFCIQSYYKSLYTFWILIWICMFSLNIQYTNKNRFFFVDFWIISMQ